MALDANIEGLKRLEQLSSLKSREVYCTINKARAITTPLMTFDDFSLKTSFVNVDLYDDELTKIVWKHTTFPEIEEPLSFKDFKQNFSYIDRETLIWGIYASSYNTLGPRDIKCVFCNDTIEQREIFADELIHDDSFHVWEEEQPFNEFVYIVEETLNLPNLYKIEVTTKLPTIADHISVLGLISPEKLKENYDKTGTLMSKSEELTVIAAEIKVFKSSDDENPDIWKTVTDKHFVVTKYFPLTLASKFLHDYNEKFNKYQPQFYANISCPSCGKEFKHFDNPEVALFRQFLRSS